MGRRPCDPGQPAGFVRAVTTGDLALFHTPLHEEQDCEDCHSFSKVFPAAACNECHDPFGEEWLSHDSFTKEGFVDTQDKLDCDDCHTADYPQAVTETSRPESVIQTFLQE